MATTFSGLIFTQASVYLVHIGNTRVYRRQGMYLKQITTDQTMYQLLLSRCMYEDAENCNKNEIYACFGGGNSAYIQPLIIEKIDNIQDDDIFVMTSDGVHEYVPIENVESLIGMDSDRYEEQLSNIVMNARKNGSPDDCSIVTIRAIGGENGTTI